jgi:hypothetical protein
MMNALPNRAANFVMSACRSELETTVVKVRGATTINNSKLKTCLASGEIKHANMAAIINTESSRKFIEAR